MRKLAAIGVSTILAAAVIAQAARPGGGSGGHQGPPPGGSGGSGGTSGSGGSNARPGRGNGGGGQGGPTSRPSIDQIFAHVDTDGNGVISESEFTAFLAHRPQPPHSTTRSSSSSQGSATSRPSADAIFKKADTDGNGTLSKAEFTAFLQAHRPPPPTSRPAN
jgi:hypothetical protein